MCSSEPPGKTSLCTVNITFQTSNVLICQVKQISKGNICLSSLSLFLSPLPLPPSFPSPSSFPSLLLSLLFLTLSASSLSVSLFLSLYLSLSLALALTLALSLFR